MSECCFDCGGQQNNSEHDIAFIQQLKEEVNIELLAVYFIHSIAVNFVKIFALAMKIVPHEVKAELLCIYKKYSGCFIPEWISVF